MLPMLKNLLVSLFIISLSSCSYSQSKTYNYPITPQGKEPKFGEDFMKIKIRSSIALRTTAFEKILSKQAITELSGIAWDEDEKLLYAVSDEGMLYHFKLSFSDNSKKRKLRTMQAVFATPLKDKAGIALKGKYSDSEGLSLKNSHNGKHGDSQLIVSFENKPRIVKYSPTGSLLKKLKIPKKLHQGKTYRSKNKALESVINHPQYGILTAAEYPIKKDSIKYQTVYAVTKKGAKKVWHFKASKAINSAITGLEILQDGSVLILERAYQNPITPIIITLRRLWLNKCNEKRECKTETIANFNGSDGWLLDNFEGLAHLQDNQYLMVSDDNQNPLQHTILVHFEIVNTL